MEYVSLRNVHPKIGLAQMALCEIHNERTGLAPVSLHFAFNQINHLAQCANIIPFIFGDFYIEPVFHGHYHFQPIKAVQTQIRLQVRFRQRYRCRIQDPDRVQCCFHYRARGPHI